MRILIVGAGPIGCYIGRLLKEKGKDLQIIEEHAEIGRPIHCAGLVSKDTLSEVKVNLNGNVVLNNIDGAEFFLNHDSFKINRKDVAVVIDRERFDRTLGEGLDINLNTRFVGIEKEGEGYLVETDKGEHCADIVIGADGANSLVRKAGGFRENIEHLRGVQFRMRYDKCNKTFVQVYLKDKFFAWLIPEKDSIVRVGIISDNPYHDLTEFLNERSIDGEILEKFAGVVPLGSCQTQAGNLVLVGDAACQVKPLTHGGLYYGMRCAEILVDCIINNQFSDYEKQWQAKFGREILIGLKMRRFYQKLNRDDLLKIFSLLKRHKDMLEKFGDFENHSKIILSLINNIKLSGFLGDMLLYMLKDLPL